MKVQFMHTRILVAHVINFGELLTRIIYSYNLSH
jgi:hypothetical protein